MFHFSHFACLFNSMHKILVGHKLGIITAQITTIKKERIIMKTTKQIYGIGLALACGLAATKGQIYVVNTDGNSIGEYGLNGSTINSSLITGLNYPQGITIVGNDLFVVNQDSASVGEYTTAGGLVNGSLISSGLANPWGIASSGGNLYIANQADAVISEYNTSGSLLNSITTVGLPPDVAVSGGISLYRVQSAVSPNTVLRGPC
jgi:hypothetical protein